MRKKIAAVLCAAAAFLTMSGCKKAPPGTLTGISISYSGMCYDDTYGFSIRNDPVDGCLFSCNYKDDEWVELENIPVEDTHWQEALLRKAYHGKATKRCYLLLRRIFCCSADTNSRQKFLWGKPY
mgnify:CR=1 FL=1